jgi:hypothetical protein
MEGVMELKDFEEKAGQGRLQCPKCGEASLILKDTAIGDVWDGMKGTTEEVICGYGQCGNCNAEITFEEVQGMFDHLVGREGRSPTVTEWFPWVPPDSYYYKNWGVETVCPSGCEALHEIQLGKLSIEDFVPPRVYSSKVYGRFRSTISDLRWHLTECTQCAKTMGEVRDQLDDFDEGELTEITGVTKQFDELLKERLDGEKSLAHREAEDWADDFSQEVLDPSFPREEIIRVDGQSIFEQRKEIAFLWAIQVSVFLGLEFRRWIETFLPPKIKRKKPIPTGLSRSAFIVNMSEEAMERYEDSREDPILDQYLSGPHVTKYVYESPDLTKRLLSAFDSLRFILRCCLLTDAFEGFWDVLDGKELFERALPPAQQSEDPSGISWVSLWDNYSDLAEIHLKCLYADRNILLPLPRHPSLEIVQAEIRDTRDTLMHFGTMQLDGIMTIEKQLADIQGFINRDSERLLREGRAIFGKSLGLQHYDKLHPNTKEDLSIAEHYYRTLPVDVDFSNVIVGFTKAFEREFRHAISPFMEKLRPLLLKRNGQKRNYTLGDYSKVFEKDEKEVIPLFNNAGLQFEEICRAVDKVNSMKKAKHGDDSRITYQEATNFRNWFIGTYPVLNCLNRRLLGIVDS